MPYIGRTLGQGTRSRFLYTATAGQTTFSGSDSQSNTLAYADNNGLDCFQNGVLLKGGGADYTATTGTSVVLTTGASVSDVIEILVYDVFAIADHVKKSGDAMTGALTNIDVNGTELILDADGDTSITSDTDDQVDIKVGGSDMVHVTTTGLGVGTNAPTMPLDVICANNKNIVSRESTPNITNGFEIVSNDSSNQAQFVSNSATGEVNLGAINTNYFLTFSSNGTTERMRITTTGTIGLGTHGSNNNINTTILLTATGNGTHSDHFWSFGPHYTADTPSFYTINEAGTGVVLSHGNTSWSTHSDERIKDNITSLENVLPDIKSVRCVKYNLKGQSDTKIGFIAQDWEAKFPEVVEENGEQVIENDGSVSMAENSESTTAVKIMQYTETIPVLLKSIQELLAKVETLEAKVTALEGK